MRCPDCDMRHLPVCSGESNPSHCAPGHPLRHQASRFASSLLGWPRRRSDAPAKRLDVVRVGFWSPVLMSIGGTETFHKTLLFRLANDPRIILSGLAVLDGTGIDAGAKVGCPITVGENALRAVAAGSDVLALWGIAEPDRWLPPRGDPARPVVVAVCHGDNGSQWSTSLMSKCSAATDHYVGVDRAAFDALPPDRAADSVIIPNAVDPARVMTTMDRAEIRASLGLHPDDVAILSLARVSEEKRPQRTIEAVSLMPEGFVLLMAGDGPEMTAVAALAAGNPRIRLLGQRHDVAELLSASDLFVSMSHSEGFGLSTAEAMLAGLPVVATPVGFLAGSPELARIVDVDADADQWATAIAADQADVDGRVRRQTLAREAIATRYSVASHVERWASYLHGLHTSRRRAAKPRVPLGVPHCAPCHASNAPAAPSGQSAAPGPEIPRPIPVAAPAAS